MKKFLKVLTTVAAVAAVVPYKGEGDENGGTLEGLLWKATWTRNTERKTEPDINITLGFNNPFKSLQKESHLFADDLVVDYDCDSCSTTVCHDDHCECDGCACADEAADEGCCCEAGNEAGNEIGNEVDNDAGTDAGIEE